METNSTPERIGENSLGVMLNGSPGILDHRKRETKDHVPSPLPDLVRLEGTFEYESLSASPFAQQHPDESSSSLFHLALNIAGFEHMKAFFENSMQLTPCNSLSTQVDQ